METNVFKTGTSKNEVATCSVDKLRTMSLQDIDNYGASIQDMIGEKSSEILQKTNLNEINSTKESLDELQAIVDKQNKGAKKAFLPIVRRFTGGYVKVEKRIDSINDALIEQKNKLDRYVTYMVEQSDSIKKAVETLRQYEDTLQAYADELDVEGDTDQIRLQAVANRLKLITGTRVNAEQALIESLMIIKANQESKYQLCQVVQNVMPVLKMQAVNAIGIKANQESIEIAEKTRKITGDLIEKNAVEVKDMVTKLQTNRTSNIIDSDKLNNAQQILIDAIESVAKASEQEAKANLDVVASLRENAKINEKYINALKDE